MLKFFLTCILFFNLYATDELKPTNILLTTGDVQDIKYKDNLLYAGTSNGTIEIFNTLTNEKTNTIKIPDIKDFMGDTISSKIYSIDFIEDKILIVSQGMKGYRNIFIYENNNLKKVIDINKKYYIQKAYFINEKEIVFALLSNQIGVYNIETKKLNYLIQVSGSSFSDFVISEDKQTLITTDESGVVREINIKSGNITKEFKAVNLDRVYQLDYKNNVVLTAGQDRKAVVYIDNSIYALDFDFLLYSCGLSENAQLGAVAYNEDNDVLIFNTKTKEYLYKLTMQEATVTKILFKNDKEVFVSSESNKINYFKF